MSALNQGGYFLECEEQVGMKILHAFKRLPFKKDQALLMFVVDEINSKLQSKKKHSISEKFACSGVVESFGSTTMNSLGMAAKEVKGD